MPKTEEKDVRKLLHAAENAFLTCDTAADVRAVFKHFYQDIGWKRLCRLFVLEYGADELYLDEQERVTKRQKPVD